MDQEGYLDNLRKYIYTQLKRRDQADVRPEKKSICLSSDVIKWSVYWAAIILIGLHNYSQAVGVEIRYVITLMAFVAGALLIVMGSFNCRMADDKARVSSICWGLFLAVIDLSDALDYIINLGSLQNAAFLMAGIITILGIWVYLGIKKPFRD